MAQSVIAITEGSGKNVDAQLTTNGYYRQTITVGDGTTDANIAPVSATYGLGINLLGINGATPISQKTMANSFPVVIASDQTAIPTKRNDTVDSNNSSTATLLSGASFTGTSTDTLGYTSIAMYVYSDQSSAANGVKIEFSSDGTNWNDATVDTFTAGVAAPNDGQTYIAACRARYMRVVYTNGGVNQTAFRLNTILREGSLTGDIIPVADVPTSAADHATLVKSAIMGKTTAGGGAWVDVKVNPSGALTTATTSSDPTGSAVPANAYYEGLNAATALPTAATAGNLVGATSDKFGRQIVLVGTIRDLIGTQTTTISASTSETTIVTAAASTFNDIKLLVISNTSATAARVDIRDTTGGSILFSLYVPAGDVRGFSLGGTPIPQTSVNTNWTAQSSASVTDLRIYAVFEKNK